MPRYHPLGYGPHGASPSTSYEMRSPRSTPKMPPPKPHALLAHRRPLRAAALTSAKKYQPKRIDGMGEIFDKYFHKAIQITNKDESELVALDMVGIQSFVLFNLQTMIVGATNDLCGGSETDLDEIVEYIGARMHDYCEAVRDLEYIKQFKDQKQGHPEDNLFQMLPSRTLERLVLESYNLPNEMHSYADKDNKKLLPGTELAFDIDHLPKFWRPLIALGTCVAVITPAIIVLLVKLKYISLIIVGGFSLIVGTILLFVPGIRTRDAIGLTAAYISLLLVVVGTKMPTSLQGG